MCGKKKMKENKSVEEEAGKADRGRGLEGGK